jgi:hypothetical protein
MNNQVNHARAAMDVLAALQGEAVSAPPTVTGRRTPSPTVAPLAPTRVPVVATGAAPEERVAPGLTQFETRPRATARRLSGLVLLASAAGAALTAWAAYDTRDVTLGGAALILAALSIGLWFLRAVTVPTTVSLVGPHLEVRRGDRRYAWDLASEYSPVDHVRGRPGRSSWRVIMRNPDGSSFAIDGSMVPAQRFTEVLARYRPEL